MKVISIVGKSGSGKTTLIRKLIPELKKHGLKIAVIKHTNSKIQFDKKGKDSDMIFNSVCDAVAVLSDDEIAIRVKSLTLDKLLKFFFATGESTSGGKDYDLVITEGFKKERFPKIEVCNSKTKKTICSKKNNLVAIIGNKKLGYNLPAIRHFKLTEIKAIAKFVLDITYGK